MKVPARTVIYITCEHGGNKIPRELYRQFSKAAKILRTHRAWDPGALIIARGLQKRLGASLKYSEISRLVVDLNRSRHHQRLFSEYTRDLSLEARDEILEQYYQPYRGSIERELMAALNHGKKVLHLSIHSFTPVLAGETRNCEIGLLYDPKRISEKAYTGRLKSTINKHLPNCRVRMNYPYRGYSDGFTTYLRKKFRNLPYSGIEIELNQRFLETHQTGKDIAMICDGLANSIVRSLESS